MTSVDEVRLKMKWKRAFAAGMMLAVLAAVGSAQFKSIGNLRGAVASYPLHGLSLLETPDVREDLALSRTQAEAIDAIVAAGKRRDDELFKGIDRLNSDHSDIPPFSTSHEEWQERGTFAVALLTPVQRTRLRAVALQSFGMLALFQSDLQKELGLSPEQIAELTALDGIRDARRNERLGALGSRFTREQLEEAVAQLQKQGEAEILAVLTPVQRDAYRKILGKPVKSATDAGLRRV